MRSSFSLDLQNLRSFFKTICEVLELQSNASVSSKDVIPIYPLERNGLYTLTKKTIDVSTSRSILCQCVFFLLSSSNKDTSYPPLQLKVFVCEKCSVSLVSVKPIQYTPGTVNYAPEVAILAEDKRRKGRI